MSSAKWRPFCLGLDVLNIGLVYIFYRRGHEATGGAQM